MNTFDASQSVSPDGELLDLLVDGELSELQRRELLMKLEHEPAGWRRCALAFLEAQQWRRELGSVAATAVPVSAVARELITPAHVQAIEKSVPVLLNETPRSSGLFPGQWFALAAGLFLAFGLGLGINQYNNAPTVSPLNSFAGPSSTDESDAAEPVAVQSPRNAVTLVVNDGAGGPNSSVQVPLVEGVVPDASWLRNLPAGLPADLRRVLEAHGHLVRQQRQLLPVQLDDGRQGVVPMDRFEIQPVSARSFQ